MTRSAPWLMLISFAATGLNGQPKKKAVEDYVAIKGIHLSLGMSHEQVSSALKPQNLYVVPGESDIWFILDGPGLSKNAHSFGLLSFDQSGLTSIRKNWNLADEKSTSEEVLFYLIDTFVQENRRQCVLSSKRVDSADEERKTAYVVCGAKRIVVGHYKSKQDGVIISSVDEILSR